MMNLSISELNKIRSIYAKLLKKAGVYIFLKNHPPPLLENFLDGCAEWKFIGFFFAELNKIIIFSGKINDFLLSFLFNLCYLLILLNNDDCLLSLLLGDTVSTIQHHGIIS